MQVNWPKWNRIINEHFVDLTKCYDRYVILYGSRGSSKSDYVSKQLIFNCLTHKYFKCILYRKVHDTIQESSYETIKQNIIALGLESLFQFRVSPLSITCMNGNKFIARGGDNALSLKSIKDPTCVWYEEEAPNEEDFATITLTVRSGKADRLQEFFTINPQVEGDFEDHWFWKRFFKDKDNLSYRATTSVKMEDLNGVKSNVTFDVSVHHSTYKHNRWLPIQAKALIESYKETNTYLYSVYALGLWTHKETGGNAYKNFVRANTVTEIKYMEGFNGGHRAYNSELPIHISIDFNSNPYMTCRIWQIKEKVAYNINEICLENPRNTSLAICREFESQYPSHLAGLFIYGDPQGLRNYTAVPTVVKSRETDYNEFAMIQNALSQYRPQMRVGRSYPPVKLRIDFMNAIFGHEEGGIKILIDTSCSKGINDYMYMKEASVGGKYLEKTKNTATGVTYEKYGHASDADEYFICEVFKKELDEFSKGKKSLDVLFGARQHSKTKHW